MKYARIINGQVLEIITPPEGYNITDCYHADIVKTCQQIPIEQDVQIGWTFADGMFTAPVVVEETPIEPTTPVVEETPTEPTTPVVEETPTEPTA